MKKEVSNNDKSSGKRKLPPPKTIEEAENQMIFLAMDLARKQLENGTASAQVITHYLKLGSSKERLDQQNISQDIKLKEAKTNAIQSSESAEELFANAISAMSIYSGEEEDEDE